MTKKIITGAIALAFATVLVPGIVAAQTGSADTEDRETLTVEELHKLLAELQAQLKTAKEERRGSGGGSNDNKKEIQAEIRETKAEIKETALILASLHEGMSSDDVKALQELLAADPDVYPEGLATGFFGPLTRRAVMRFQAKHGLEQAGVVGPQTRRVLFGLLKESDLKCRAWGRLVAAQKVRRFGNLNVTISDCANVPPGIAKKLDGFATSTATSTDGAPRFTEIEVEVDSDTRAEIEWRTNEKTTGVLWLDDDAIVSTDGGGDSDRERSARFNNNHKVRFKDLLPGTTYYFVIVAIDKDGNEISTPLQSFTTEESDEADNDEEDEDQDEENDDEDEDEDEDNSGSGNQNDDEEDDD